MTDFRIPIAIGVTGHRDLLTADIDALNGRVRAFFLGLRARYPSSPLLVLSPLAEGADRLVAQIAVAEFEARLVVPMPLPRGEYEKDFFTPQSRAEFDRLLKKAITVIDVGLVPGATPASIAVDGPDRDRQYEAAGAWVARHSQMLIALWDGDDSSLPGSTGAVVNFKLGRRLDPSAPDDVRLDPPECGPVYHVSTPRRHVPAKAVAAISSTMVYPQNWGPTENARREWENVLDHIERFNTEARMPDARLQRTIAASRSRESGSCPGEHSSLLDHHAAADALALRYRNRRRWSTIGVFFLATTALCSFVFYDDVFLEEPWSPQLLYSYLAIFAGAYVLYHLCRRRRHEDNYLEYRALSEGLRVQLQWSRSGIDAISADHYLRKQRTDLDWIRAAMRNCHLCDTRGPTRAPGGDIAAIRDVARGWVETQRDWFASRMIASQRRERRLELSATALVLVAFATSSVLALAHYAIAEHRMLLNSFIAGISLMLAFAGVLKGYAATMAPPEESKQYRRMECFFRRAAERLSPLVEEGRVSESRTVLLEVGKEALRENGDWMLLHRARPMEVPAG